MEQGSPWALQLVSINETTKGKILVKWYRAESTSRRVGSVEVNQRPCWGDRYIEPLWPIAVWGKYRTGKSYLLNKIISPSCPPANSSEEEKSDFGFQKLKHKYISEQSAERIAEAEIGFKVGPTINACTKGILIWSQPIEITKDGRELSCIVMDSEGIGSIKNTK